MTTSTYEAISRARRQVDGGNPEGGAYTLETFLATDPHNIEARSELALIYGIALKNMEKGIFQIDVVLDIDPDSIEGLKASVTLRAKERKYTDEALGQYERLMKLVSPKKDREEYGSVCNSFALFLRKQVVDFPRSREYYEMAIGACPDRYEYHQDYAVLLLNDVKDYVRAKEELETVMELKPGDANVERTYRQLLRDKFDKNGNPKKSLRERLIRRRGTVSSRTRRVCSEASTDSFRGIPGICLLRLRSSSDCNARPLPIPYLPVRRRPCPWFRPVRRL